jgi:hypothetical protein
MSGIMLAKAILRGCYSRCIVNKVERGLWSFYTSPINLGTDIKLLFPSLKLY